MTRNRYYVTTRAFLGDPDGTLDGNSNLFYDLAADALRAQGGFGIGITTAGGQASVSEVILAGSKRAARQEASLRISEAFTDAAKRCPEVLTPPWWSGINDPYEQTAVRLSKPSRFMWWAPWKVVDPWELGVRRGGDEWHNPSIMVSVPLLGVFIVFYGWRFNREQVHPDSAVRNIPNVAYVPGCKVCDELREAFNG